MVPQGGNDSCRSQAVAAEQRNSTGKAHLHEGAERIELLLSVLIIVALARNTNAHPVRHILDPLAPQVLVELLVYPHVRGAHDLLRELAHLVHGTGRPGLEGPARADNGHLTCELFKVGMLQLVDQLFCLRTRAPMEKQLTGPSDACAC